MAIRLTLMSVTTSCMLLVPLITSTAALVRALATSANAGLFT
jgi:hypothetical protein